MLIVNKRKVLELVAKVLTQLKLVEKLGMSQVSFSSSVKKEIIDARDFTHKFILVVAFEEF